MAILGGEGVSGAVGDLIAPTSTANAPQYSSIAQFDVPYSASDTGGSGVQTVDLYVRAPGQGAYSKVATDTSPASPTFSYLATVGDGAYRFYTVATDSDGNAEAAPLTPPDATTTLDTATPGSSAGASRYHTGLLPISVSFTADDPGGSGIKTVRLYVKGPLDSQFNPYASQSGTSGTFMFTPSAQGDYAFYTVATDNADNEEDAPTVPDALTTYDTAAPTTTDDVPAGYQAGSVTVTLTATDPSGSGVDNTYYTTDGTTPSASSAVYDPAAKPTLADGQVIKYFSIDKAGNAESVNASAPAKVDAIAPATQVTGGPTVTTPGELTLTYSASDSGGSLLSTIELWVKRPSDLSYAKVATNAAADPAQFAYTPDAGDGTYRFYTVGVDGVGNREAIPGSADHTALIDSSAPSSQATSPSHADTSPIAVDYSAADPDGSGVASVQLWVKRPGDSGYALAATDATPASSSFAYVPDAGNGDYRFYTVATDTVGNAEAIPTTLPDATTTLDTAAPSSSATSPRYTSTANVTVAYTAADATAGVASVELWVKSHSDLAAHLAATDSDPSTPTIDYALGSGPGDYEFHTIAVDAAGNREAAPGSADLTTTFETDGPISGITSGPLTVQSGSVALSYSATDPQPVLAPTPSGVDRVELWVKRPSDAAYALADTDATPASPSFAYVPDQGDGLYRFYTLAVDVAGNREAVPGSPDHTTRRDTAAPATTDDVPATFQTAAVVVTLSAADPGGSGVDKTYYTKGAAPPDPTTSSSVYDPTSKPSLADGELIRYFSVDVAGNAEPIHTSGAARVDSIKPSSEATSPTYDDAQISVTYTAADTGGSGVASVELWVKRPGDSSFSLAATDANPETPSFTYEATQGDGAYAFYTRARDAAAPGGNLETAPASADSTTAVDTAAPATTDDVPAGYQGTPVAVTLTASDPVPGSAVAATYYTTDGTSPTTSSSAYDAASKPTLADGETIKYFSIDNAGNAETVKTSTAAKVDEAKPSSAASAPAYSSSAAVTIPYSVSDTGGAGVASVELWVKRPGDGSYSLVLTDATPASPSFGYTADGGNGSYDFYTRALDAAGNREDAPAQADSTTVVNGDAPLSEASSPQFSADQQITVSYTATDPDAGPKLGPPPFVDGVTSVDLYVRTPGSSGFVLTATDSDPATPSFTYVAGAGDGDYAFYTVAHDDQTPQAPHNVTEIEPPPAAGDSTTTLDTVRPTSAGSAPQYSATNAITIGYSSGDDRSGTNRVELWVKAPSDASFTKVQIDNTPDPAGTFAYTAGAGDGTYSFYTRAADNAGNYETAPGTPDATSVVDTQAPTTTDDVPGTFQAAAVVVTLTRSDTGGSGVDKTYYTTDGTTPTTSSSAYDPANKPTLQHGERIKYFSVDNAGNTEAVNTSGAAQIDTQAPTTTDDVPADFRSSPITVSLSAADGAGMGVDKTYYTTDGSTPTTSSSVYDPANRPTLQHGERIKYFSVDNAGNTEAVKTSDAAQIDPQAPTTTDDVPGTFQSAAVVVTLTRSDTGGSGIDKTYYTTDGTTPTTSSSLYDATNKPALQHGQTIKYFSTDNAGNTEAVKTSGAARVDTQAPTTTDDVPTSPQSGPVRVTLSAVDSGGSGVDRTYYTTDGTTPTTSSSVYDAANKPTLGGSQRLRYFSVDNAGNSETLRSSPVLTVTVNPPPSPQPQPLASFNVGRDRALARVLRSGLKLSFVAAEPVSGRVQLWLDARTAHRLRLTRVVGTATIAETKAGARTIKIKFSRKAQTKLGKQRRVNLKAKATVTGASGKTQIVKRSVRLTR